MFGEIIGGGLGFLGQERSNKMNYRMFREGNQFNAQQAMIQRNWQQYMSDTAISRQMSDMKRAGVNPIMAVAKGGGAASTPSGAQAKATQPNPSQSSMGAAASSASNIINAKAAEAAAKAKTDMVEANQAEIRAKIDKMKIEGRHHEWQMRKIVEDIALLQEQTQSAMERRKGITFENAAKEVQAAFIKENPAVEIARWYGLDGKALAQIFSAFGFGSIADVLKSVKSPKNKGIDRDWR